MAKIKKYMDKSECVHVIFPLGKGLPLCTYTLTKEHKIMKLKDFPMCNKRKCPLKQEEGSLNYRKDE